MTARIQAYAMLEGRIRVSTPGMIQELACMTNQTERLTRRRAIRAGLKEAGIDEADHYYASAETSVEEMAKDLREIVEKIVEEIANEHTATKGKARVRYLMKSLDSDGFCLKAARKWKRHLPPPPTPSTPE